MHRACVLFTGGKDSTYALHWAVLHGFHVVGLISIVPEGWDSMLYHYPGTCSGLVDLAARALGLPLLKRRAPRDRELEALVDLLKRAREEMGCEAVVSGALLSDYQRLRFSVAAEEAGLRSFTPLWRKSQEEYMRSLVREGFRVMVLSVQAYGLPSWLVGRVLDEELVEEVIRRAHTYGFNPAFEGGEAETLVVDAPLYRYRLRVRGCVRRLAPDHYVLEVAEAWLEPKEERSAETTR